MVHTLVVVVGGINGRFGGGEGRGGEVDDVRAVSVWPCLAPVLDLTMTDRRD